MARKIVFTAILVAFTLLFQYGCQTTEVTEEPVDIGESPVLATTQEEPAKVDEAEPAASGPFVLRIDCGGYEEYTDKAGNVWQPDREKTEDNKWGAVYGSTIGRAGLGIEGTDCPLIYENERYSMDAYEFEVPAGKYTVILHFAETYEGIYGVGQRVFGVSINGNEVLKDFDPYADAGEFNTPSVKKYKDIEPKDGKIIIGFTPKEENPQINGIEIISGDSGETSGSSEKLAIRVNCGTEDGAEAYTDEEGKVWQPDRLITDDLDWGAVDGDIIQRPTLEIKDTKSQGIYQSETYSMSAYKFKVPAGKYTVTLHFAETYEGISGEGQRVFNVSINDKKVLEDLDPYKEAGDFAKPLVKEFKGIEPVDGAITIGFESGVENPQICGIEVVSQ